jgi:hypothetical protein
MLGDRRECTSPMKTLFRLDQFDATFGDPSLPYGSSIIYLETSTILLGFEGQQIDGEGNPSALQHKYSSAVQNSAIRHLEWSEETHDNITSVWKAAIPVA